MEIKLDDVEFLLSERGQSGLAWLETQNRDMRNRLALTSRLRQTYTPHEGGLLLEQWELREQARQRQVFRDAEGKILERKGLQQATHWQVGEHRARQLRERIGAGTVAELGCGLGGDTLELSRGGKVLSWDLDPARARMAAHNCSAATVQAGDLFEHLDEARADALFVDPARRSGERRIFDPEQYQPPLSAVLALRDRFPVMCVKAGPGIADEFLPEECDVEFISQDRTCKEAVLWLYTGASGRRASILTSQGWMSRHEEPLEGPGDLEVGGYIHEPDPSLLRARALGELGRDLEAGWLDPKIGYLVGTASRTHVLAHTFRVLDVGSLHAKQIAKRIEGLKLWPLEIKKRGVDIEPEEYRKSLKIKGGRGSRPGVLLLTRRYDEHLAILAERITSQDRAPVPQSL